ncbi:MAG: acyl-CoA dehydratase activase [Bacillota bacterium]
MSLVAGIDVGSTSTKAFLINGLETFHLIRPTGWSPRDTGTAILEELLQRSGFSKDQLQKIVVTGYGRVSLTFADKSVTEISCHARGAAYLVPGLDTIIDIGGQDSKVIKVNSSGQVLDFFMNDKCAAGTGRFLQVMAHALGLDVSDLGNLPPVKPVTISNMCTVFAESEVIGLLAQGAAKESIVSGLHLAIAKRISSMVHKFGNSNKIVFTGGVALNQGVQRSLEQELGMKVYVPEKCQLAGALGAALIAQDLALKN